MKPRFLILGVMESENSYQKKQKKKRRRKKQNQENSGKTKKVRI
jgi:hypothetical protein